jgi:hypothetical protein
VPSKYTRRRTQNTSIKIDSTAHTKLYRIVSGLERELQMVQLSATKYICIAILWISLASFAAITLCVASQRAIPTVSIYFVIDSVLKFGYTVVYWLSTWFAGAGIFLFSTASKLALGPTQPPIYWVPGALTPGLKRPERETNHSLPSGAEVNSAWSCTSTFPVRLHDVLLS